MGLNEEWLIGSVSVSVCARLLVCARRDGVGWVRVVGMHECIRAYLVARVPQRVKIPVPLLSDPMINLDGYEKIATIRGSLHDWDAHPAMPGCGYGWHLTCPVKGV
jgi:hypothetical protein